jgi:hypothetical protein
MAFGENHQQSERLQQGITANGHTMLKKLAFLMIFAGSSYVVRT